MNNIIGGSDCKFNIGDKVSISDKTLRFINPFRDEYVKFKAGYISNILAKSEYTIPPFICLYEVTFKDGTIATEIPEYDLRKSIDIVSETSSLPSPTTSETGTMTDTFPPVVLPYTPKKSDSKPDMLTLIALNALSESLRDSLKPKIVYNPYLDSTIIKQEVQYIGNEEYLQDEISEYFHAKTLKWIENEIDFKKAKKHLKFLKTRRGIPYIKKVLKSFVKKFKKNWYELRDEDTYDDVQEYIRIKLISI